MPTEADFRSAAAALRRAAGDVEAARRHIVAAADADGVSGGTIAATIERSCEEGTSDAAAVRDLIWFWVDESERRAAVCAEHAAALRAWEARLDAWSDAGHRHRLSRDIPDWNPPWPGDRPIRPVAPYEWVEPA